MKKTAAFVEFASSISAKYELTKNATITDVALDCLDEIKRYTTDPASAGMYTDPQTQEKIKAAKHALTELVRHLNTPSNMRTTHWRSGPKS